MAFNSGLQLEIEPILKDWLGDSLRKRKHPTPPPIEMRPPLGKLYTRLEQNISPKRGVLWANRRNKNWRFEKQPKNNSVGEKLLEKNISAYARDWVNQVPTCSGYSDGSDSKRAIDLVQYCGPGHFKFVELKTTSNNAVYAAAELSLYGLTYLLARSNGAVWRSDRKEPQILLAKRIELVVLAPQSFFSGYERRTLLAFEQNLCAAISDFSARRSGPTMTFRFETLPCEKWIPGAKSSPEAIRGLVAGIRPVF